MLHNIIAKKNESLLDFRSVYYYISWTLIVSFFVATEENI